MNNSFTKGFSGRKLITGSLTAFLMFFVQQVMAHTVDSYTSACNAGPVYSVDANVSAVNSASNYAWQYKNSSGVWVCIVNGNNTINGVTYSVSGATSTATTNPNPIVFNNPGSGLQGLVIRCVISDGAGVNPCNEPAGNIWNNGTGSNNHTINVTGTPCANTGNCNCPGNLVQNPSFENGTTSWSSWGGNFYTNTYVPVCGSYHGEIQMTSSWGGYFQDITGIAVGSTVTLTAWGGVHNNSFDATFRIEFYNSSNTFISNIVSAQIDNILPNMTQRTVSGVVPAGTAKVRVVAATTGDYLKADQFCLTATASGLGSIGDRVWFDADGDGIQDASETGGITGVTVQLKNSAGTVIATTTTNGSGNYLFSGLAAGTYRVVFPASISGAIVTGQNVGNNDDIDSDASQATGETGNIVLAAGQNIINVDAGYCPTTLELGNRVWYDANNDGINSGENGIAFVTLNLYKDDNNDNVADGAAIATTTTDGDGFYMFSNLGPGNYIVGVVTPRGYMSSSVNGGDPDNDINLDDNGQVFAGNETRGLAITLVAGTEPDGTNTNTNINITYDFGFLPDCACVNSAGNRLVNGSFESGTTGWNWSGGNVTTGTGYVACGAKNGFLDWTSGTARIWQDVSGIAPGSTVTFSAFAGTHTPGIACSPRISLIFLSATGAVLGQSDAVVTRDVDVNFSQLENYSITAVAPPGTATVRAQGSITCNTLKIDAFCLTVTPPASLGDRVWKDDDRDGIQDPGEVGLAGVTLTLLNSAGQVVATTTTDAFGIYKFSNLAPGNYTVRITPPANYSLSPRDQGSDENTDSDFDQVSSTTGTITLTAGQNRTDVDAGLVFSQPGMATVGDRVWLDLDSDGTQDAGEPGVSNVLVTLYNSGGVAVKSTYTDVNGNYLFTEVVPGSYTVGVSLPVGTVFTTNTGAISSETNSDVNPATGRTVSFTVNTGDQIRYVDAGIKTQQQGNGSIGDFVWNDLDKDGVQDAGEPGIPNVTVRLYDANTNTVIRTTTTDALGIYIFNDVPTGDYFVEFVTPAGYTRTVRNNTNPVQFNTDSDMNTTTGRTNVFSLNTGQRITSVDAGFWLTTPPGTAKLGDRVWYDVDQDGVQDAGEPGVAGVTVVLYNSTGTAIGQTTTDQNGLYIFTDLAAGTYSVGFSNLPQGFTFTTPGLGTAATGSDADPATGRTAAVTLVAAQTNLDVDAGLRQALAGTASLGNRVWFDLNNNGLQDAGELGVQGVTVELLDNNNNPIDRDPITAGVQPTTAVTNALGEYLFTGLAAGQYRVRFSSLPAGYVVVAKNAGTNRDIDNDGNALSAGASLTDMVSLAINQERLDIDLGIFNPTAPLGQLGDRVWFDVNNNGVQDAGEQGVPGVSVALLNAAGTVIATTTTDGSGLYKFVNLADGTYSVQFGNLPAGFSFSPRDVVTGGGNDTNDSDADPATGTTGTYTITGGNTNLTVDAGIYSTRAALGDYVWEDTNGNGIQEATERPIAGVTVTLFDNAGNAVTSMITDQNGRYFFSNLNPGTYTVGFSTVPDKLTFTTKDATADANDSDVNPATGRTDAVVLAAGQVNLTVDAGLKPFVPATIGDYVWDDRNADGLQGANEPGVAGILVTLYNSANIPIGSAITDGNGKYLITNVPPGTGYYLIFTNKPGGPASTWTVQNNPANINTNSKVNSSGQTGTFSVSEGQTILNLDAGLILPSSLPVQLISFNGALEGSNARLNWSTAQELNTSHYELERSTDGSNFSKVATVSARGNSQTQVNYSQLDNLSGIRAGKVYYRLHIVDRNGAIQYSNVVVIRLGDVKLNGVYPNPFVSEVKIDIESRQRAEAVIRLAELSGKTVLSISRQLEAGGNQVTVSGLDKLAAGAYLLEIRNGDDTIITRLIKK